MRKHPDRGAEVVSQAIFSEQIALIEQIGEWVKIETLVDHYLGWVQKDELHLRNTKFFEGLNDSCVQVSRHAAHLYHVQDTIYGPILTLPFESQLKLLDPLDESSSRWLKVGMHNGREAYIQRGDISLTPTRINSFEEICVFSQKFIGLPYTWGGRSSFGYDCSGFVQMLYRQMGIYLPRDSKDQCHWKGFKTVPIVDMQPGDLIFFGLDEEKIRHVGMYVKDQHFINATVLENMPYIHMSPINGPEWQEIGRYPFRTAKSLII